MGGSKDYIPFANSNLNAYFAETYGDGVGITFEEAAAITEFPDGFFPDMVMQKDGGASSFEELNYFTGLKSLPDRFCTNTSYRNALTITNLDLPNLESVGYECFYGSKLNGCIYLPKLKTAGDWAFQGTEVIHAEFGAEFQTWPEGLFYDCTDINTIEVEDLQTINDKYFFRASGRHEFVYITFWNKYTVATFGVDLDLSSTYKKNVGIYVKNKFLDTYKSDTNWTDNNTEIIGYRDDNNKN